jgi:hypothetical protein
MAKLILKFEDRILREYGVGTCVTIGRLPDNGIVIENPTVSSHHARVVQEGDSFFVEDLESTNGTYVNELPISRRTLNDGDVVLIGKHRLEFDRNGMAQAEEALPALSGLQDTVYLDTEKHRALLAKIGQATRRPDAAPSATSSTTNIGVLRVLAGETDRTEYNLDQRTCLIGKSGDALVRLRGWFKPKVAVAIARNSDGYVATIIDGHTRINSRPERGRYHLKDGDVLEVSGVLMVFGMKRAGQVSALASPVSG